MIKGEKHRRWAADAKRAEKVKILTPGLFISLLGFSFPSCQGSWADGYPLPASKLKRGTGVVELDILMGGISF